MAIFDNELYNDLEERLRMYSLNRALSKDTDEEELTTLLEEPRETLGIQDAYSTQSGSSGLSVREIRGNEELGKASKALYEGVMHSQGGFDDMNFKDITGFQEQPTSWQGSNIEQINIENPKLNQAMRRYATYEYSKLSSADTAMWQTLERWDSSIGGNATRLSPDAATAYARAMGSDLKFSTPKTYTEIEQAVSTNIRQRELKEALSKAYTTGDKGHWNNAQVIAAGIAGGIGPAELGITVASAFVPFLAASKLAQGARVLQKILGLKKVLDAAKAAQKVNTANKIARGALAGATAEEGFMASVWMRNGTNLSKVSQLEARNIQLASKLEEMSGMTYATLRPQTKMLGDVGTMLAVDVPFINLKKSNSDKLETGVYSEQDKMVETLMAASLGVFVPAGFRWAGKRMGIMPAEMFERNLQKAALRIDTQEALGEITSEAAAKQRRAVAELRANQQKIADLSKPIHPKLEEGARILQQNITSDETLAGQYLYFAEQVRMGRRPRISEFPEFERLFSSIDASVIRNLLDTDIVNAFGSTILRSSSPTGLAKVAVRGDSGLLGRNVVTALSEVEALSQLEKLYKGTVLQDANSRLEFQNWANRYHGFSVSMSELYDDYMSQFRQNIQAKKTTGKGVLTSNELIDMRTELRNRYIDYKLDPDNAQEFKNILDDRVKADALGDALQEIPEEYRTILDEFEELYSRLVEEKVNKNGDILYNLKDNGRPFRELLDDLADGAKENSALAEVDNVVKDIRQEQVETFLRNANNLDVTPDTTIDSLFGTTRKSLEDLTDLDKQAESMSSTLALRQIQYNSLVTDPDISFAKRTLEKFGAPDPTVKNLLTRNNETLSYVNEIRTTGFQDIKTNFVKQLKDSASFQKNIQKYLVDGKLSRAVKLAFRDALKSSLAEAKVSERIGSTRDLVNQVTVVFEREIERNPEKIKAFASPETLQELEQFTEWTSTPQKLESSAKISASLNTLLAPLEKGLNFALDKIELRAMNDLSIMYIILDTMFKNPEVAAEVLTGRATQTIYSYTGSKRNIEYLSKQSVFYINDIKNQLKGMESQTNNGQSLLDIYLEKSNTDDIREAMIRLKHGEPKGDNSDFERIAKVLTGNEATILSSFDKFGSTYRTAGSMIDRSKLRFADSVITDIEVDDFAARMEQSLNIDPDTILADLQKQGTPEGVIRGTETVPVDKKLKRDLIKAIGTMQDAINDITTINNPVYRKTAIWALRDFDLDTMFDRGQNARLSLNAVRDALFSGDWKGIMAGDAQRFMYAASDLRQIVTSLVGEKLAKDELGNTIIDPTKWVVRFRQGFNDVSAVTSGRKSGYLDAFEDSITFKDAESEIQAVKWFGTDSVDESIKNNYERMFKAYYSLEMFGSEPMGIVDILVDTYNRARKSDPTISKKFMELAKEHNIKNPEEKYGISPGAYDSIKQNVLFNTGLQDAPAAWWVRAIKATTTFLSAPLLFKAGLKSVADYGTIWQGLVLNSYVDSHPEAMALSGKVTKFLVENPKIRNMVTACGVVEQEEIVKKLLNDPSADIMSLSKATTPLDKYEAKARQFADLCLNKVAQIGSITNHNKQVAAMSIQVAIADHAHIPFQELKSDLRMALNREGITQADWDFMRTNLVHDVYEGTGFNKTDFDIFDPYTILKISDESLEKELVSRGVKNITPDVVNDFRAELISKAWNIVDTSADEMVSLPSNRIMNIMRGGRARNTGWGTFMEIMTQFNSFGASLVMSTYGRTLANFVGRETGVSILDVLNPLVKLNHATHPQIYGTLLAAIASVATAGLIVESAVNAMTGNIQKPIDEEGNIHLDNITAPLFGSLGIGGTVLDATIEGITGAGQRGGGFTMQVAPSVSNAMRTMYRIGKPILSKNIDMEDKPGAITAAVTQEVARATGLRSLPLVSLIYQDFIGSWLDMQAAGGYSNYERMLQNRERRGMVIMPWETNPEPFTMELFGN